MIGVYAKHNPLAQPPPECSLPTILSQCLLLILSPFPPTEEQFSVSSAFGYLLYSYYVLCYILTVFSLPLGICYTFQLLLPCGICFTPIMWLSLKKKKKNTNLLKL